MKRNKYYSFVNDNLNNGRLEYVLENPEDRFPTKIGFTTREKCESAKSTGLSYYACKESNRMIGDFQMKTINCGPFMHTNQTFQAGSNRIEDQTYNHYSQGFFSYI